MHKRLLLLLPMILLTISSYGQRYRTADKYLDFVARQQNLVVKNMWRYTQAIAHSKNQRTVDKKRTILLRSFDRAIGKIDAAPSFENDTLFKQKVLENLNVNKILLTDDYSEIVDMQDVANQSYDAMEAYILAQELADQKMEQTQKEYERHLYDFAGRYEIEILEDKSELGRHMETTNRVFDYYNDLFLVAMKVQFNENNLMGAIERKDVSAIRQGIDALHTAAELGLNEVYKVPLFKNDDRIAKATEKIFEFHVAESQDEMPQILDYIVLKEDFESIKDILEKTPLKDRTQSQIESYNTKIDQIDAQRDAITQLFESLTKKRTKLFEKLEKANAKFLDKHVPKFEI